MWEQLVEWDTQTLIYFNKLGSSSYDAFWVFCTQIKNWTPLYALFFFLFLIAFPLKKAIKGISFTLLALGLSIGLTELVKLVFKRVRPNNLDKLTDQLRILQTPEDYSFFSGHAAVSMAVSLFVIYALGRRFKWIIVCLLWPVLFCFSRLYVGVHYPSDILTGIVIGSVLGYMTIYVHKRTEKGY